jgi:hypothetical protein
MIKYRCCLLAAAAAVVATIGARAADLPATKAPPPAGRPNCFSTFWTWLDSSAADCPLSAYGITVYGTIDFGGGWTSEGSRFNRDQPNGIQNFIGNTSFGPRWQPVPGGLGASNAGIKWRERIASDWYFVGDVNFGFDPYSLRFTNGPQSLVDNNTLPLALRSTNSDSSRAYGPINNRANAGFSNSTFGTLTFGRHTTFANDNASAYDPFNGAYAFSLIGSSASYVQGMGLTEMARYTDSVKYFWSNNGVRVGGMAGLGGYDGGNNARQLYEFDLGGDYAGFSGDVTYQYAEDAVNLGAYGSVPPAPLDPNTLKATLQNLSAVAVMGKYKFEQIPLTLFGGYEFSDISAPSDLTPGLVRRFNDGDFGVEQANAYPADRHLQVFWIGERYGILKNLDWDAGWYHAWQNNYTAGTATCAPNKTAAVAGESPQGSNNSKCSGTFDVLSTMLDYHPVKRVDIYGGVSYSVAAGGLANGFQKSVDIAPTAGIRVSW